MGFGADASDRHAVRDDGNWRVLRTITLSGYTGDSPDPAASQTIPVDTIKLESLRRDGSGSPTTGVAVTVKLEDSGNDPEPRGSATFDLRVFEIVDDGVNSAFVSEGAERRQCVPFRTYTFHGCTGTTVDGSVGVHITNPANMPGAAVTAVVLIREL